MTRTAPILTALTPDPEHTANRWARPYAVTGARGVFGRVYLGASVTFRRHGLADGREMLPWHPDALPVFSVWFDMTAPEAGEGTLTVNGVTYRGGVYRTVPAPEHSNIRFDGTVYEPVVVMATRLDYGAPTDSARSLFWEMSQMVRDMLLTPEGRNALVSRTTVEALVDIEHERVKLSAQADAGADFLALIDPDAWHTYTGR